MIIKIMGVEEIVLGLGEEKGKGLRQNPDGHKIGEDQEGREGRDQGD